jgi:site-specific recombinase
MQPCKEKKALSRRHLRSAGIGCLLTRKDEIPVPHIFLELADPALSNDIGPLQRLIADLRPRSSKDVKQATGNLQALCHALETRADQAELLRAYLSQILCTRKISHLLTETGISKNTGFWSVAWQRLNYKWLPPVRRDEYMKDVFGKIFDHTDDYRWVGGVDDAVWIAVVHGLGFHDGEATPLRATLTHELLSAIQVLSYRISAIGLEPELVRNCPTIEEFESPFLRQNVELNEYASRYITWMADPGVVREDARHIDVLLTQCEEIVGKIRRASAVHGISVSLTRLLLRLTESILRLRRLLALLDAAAEESSEVAALAVRLFKELVQADNLKHSLSDLVKTNTELLALQVTEHASRSGDHYVTRTRSEWWGMLRSALGAGFIIGFMALLKLLASKLTLAPFDYALLYSLNYGLGFMLIHVLHFTIATKQPAMTAALMAQAIDEGKQKLNELMELIIRVVRSQFIAILGNIVLAMPVAYLLALLWQPATGHPLADVEKAHHLLHDLDPLHGLAVFYAAIAGICLFLSGLISGYYDNKAAYRDIAARIEQLRWLTWLLGKPRLTRVATYIGNNLGALAGNFFFGVMLGCIGTFGIFFGLPLDIRHITFSSANMAFALVGMGNQLSPEQWILSVSGLALIGLTNLAVSFTLALTVALRSRNVNLRREWAVVGMLGRRFLSDPRVFFLPPPDPIPDAANLDAIDGADAAVGPAQP